MLITLLLSAMAGVGYAYDHDPNDFAAEVVSYVEGTGADPDYLEPLNRFNDPNNALGRPTIDTTGDNWNIQTSSITPVVSVYGAFRYFELVAVGNGGELVVKFNHAVADDINNPYGIDLIVFGNAQQNTGLFWKNGDPTSFNITGSSVIEEPGMVSVSQDGLAWYNFDPNTSPTADTFAPTLGRTFDPNNADTSIGAWNQWWGEPTDATLPIDPNITSYDILGLTVAGAAELYGASAGGTGFDLADVGLDWIQYVKFTGNDYVTPDIDAVSDVAACGDYKHPFPTGDVNQDCIVDVFDILLLAENWLDVCQGDETDAGIGDIYQDCSVDMLDFAKVSEGWLDCTWGCE
jgi:hypothetical protein